MAKYNNGRYDHLRQAEELAHFSQAIEIENKTGRTIDREVVAAVTDSDTQKENRSCYTCGKKGHLKIYCNSKNKTKEEHYECNSEDEVILMVQDGNGDARKDWILYSGKAATSSMMSDWCYTQKNAAMRCHLPTMRS